MKDIDGCQRWISRRQIDIPSSVEMVAVFAFAESGWELFLEQAMFMNGLPDRCDLTVSLQSRFDMSDGLSNLFRDNHLSRSAD